MKNFAYIHVERFHDLGRGTKATRQYKPRSYTRYWGVQGCWEHDMRLIETANADPARFSKNTIVCEETGWKPAELSQETIKTTGCNHPDFVSKKVREFIEKHHTGDKLRDDCVLACMLLSAVSPQFLRDMTTPEWGEYLSNTKLGLQANLQPLNVKKVNLWKNATIQYYRKKYGDRIMCMMFHDDELNPHCTVYLVPLIEKMVKKRGPSYKNTNMERETRSVRTLCAKEMFTPDDKIWQPGVKGKRGRWKLLKRGTCSHMQDEYADFLRVHGLKVRRGNRRNPNRPALQHETNRERYERNLTAINEIKALQDTELRPFLEAKAADMADADRLRIERDHHQIIAADNQEISDQLKKMAAKLKRKLSDSQRELPLVEVIQKLTGLDPIEPDGGSEPYGTGTPPKKKRTDIQFEFLLPNGMRLGITNRNTFENLTRKIPFLGKYANRITGKGALDAVMYLTGWEFRSASEWIADNYSAEAAGKAIAQNYINVFEQNRDDNERIMRKNHAETLIRELETNDDSQWGNVRSILTKTLGFHENSINLLHSLNWISANSHGHIVFDKAKVVKNIGLVSTGKIVIDPRNLETSLFETGDDGFYMDLDKNATHTVICATPLDALAIRSTPAHYAANVIAVGKNPTEETKESIQALFGSKLENVHFAENLMAAGRKLSAWIRENFGERIELLPLPDGFRHWFDFHRRPRVKSEPADLGIVQFPDRNMAGPDEVEMQ